MWGVVVKFIIGLMASFYLFPVEFTFFLGQNTKKLLAVVGLFFLLYNSIKKLDIKISKSFLIITTYALLVTLAGILSTTINSTPDYAYASYVVSMWVWLGGAYAVVSMMKIYHKKVTVETLCWYLMGVCVAQCLIALAMDLSPALKLIVDRYFVTTIMNDVERRLYGIGCALDVAGTRFSAVLIIIAAVLIKKGNNMSKGHLIAHIVSFLVIAVVGNMIARTTIVGLVIAVAVILIRSSSINVFGKKQRVVRWIVVMVIALIQIVSFYYETNSDFRENLRFGFEGFFSLAEEGQWEIDSNERLKAMIVFPDNIKTWLIGDGYFDGPTLTDPYYVGPVMTGFYMWTDVGYLRLIFYFGLFGLMSFMLFFIKCTQISAKDIPDYSMLIWLLLLLNFVIWFKVSTDIFVVFALFLCIGNMQDQTPRLEEEV